MIISNCFNTVTVFFTCPKSGLCMFCAVYHYVAEYKGATTLLYYVVFGASCSLPCGVRVFSSFIDDPWVALSCGFSSWWDILTIFILVILYHYRFSKLLARMNVYVWRSVLRCQHRCMCTVNGQSPFVQQDRKSVV